MINQTRKWKLNTWEIGNSMNSLPQTEFFPFTSKNIPKRNGGTKADNLMKPISGHHQIRNPPPTTFPRITTNLTDTSGVIPVMLFVEHIYEVTQSNTFQASQLIILITVKQPIKQLLGHYRNLAKLHCFLINFPQIKRRPARGIAQSSQNKLVLTRNQERKQYPRRP